MTIKFATPLFCTALSLFAAATTALAESRTTTAFTSFHVRYPENTFQSPYSCLAESYGAVVNRCSYQVGLMFDLPIERPGVYNIAVQSYAFGTGTSGASCYAWTYDGNGDGAPGTSGTFTSKGSQTLTLATADMSDPNETIALLCDVPVGEGIASVNTFIPGNAAEVVSQVVPASMSPATSYTVSITMKNIGQTTWSGSSYHLGSQDPQDNTTWGPNRVNLTSPVPPGQEAVFTFAVTDPNQVGSFGFQWRMVQDGVEWFGDSTPALTYTNECDNQGNCR